MPGDDASLEQAAEAFGKMNSTATDTDQHDDVQPERKAPGITEREAADRFKALGQQDGDDAKVSEAGPVAETMAQPGIPDLSSLTDDDWQAIAESHTADETQQLRAVASWQQDRAKQRDEMAKLIPGWDNPKVQQKEMRELVQFAMQKGVTQEEIVMADRYMTAKELHRWYQWWKTETRGDAMPESFREQPKPRNGKRPETGFDRAAWRARSGRASERLKAAAELFEHQSRNGPQPKRPMLLQDAMQRLEKTGTRRDAAKAFELLGRR